MSAQYTAEELYEMFVDRNTDPAAIATTTEDEIAFQVADLIGDNLAIDVNDLGAQGFPTEDSVVDFYAIARQIIAYAQSMVSE